MVVRRVVVDDERSLKLGKIKVPVSNSSRSEGMVEKVRMNFTIPFPSLIGFVSPTRIAFGSSGHFMPSGLG